MDILGPLTWARKLADLFRAEEGLRKQVEGLEPGGPSVLVELPEDYELKAKLGGNRYEIDAVRLRRLGKKKAAP